jgi:predicted TIM-barrel fold metal-dependent hydrolase
MAEIESGLLGAQLTIPDRRAPTHGLLPDPEPEDIAYTIISVDDHLVEPRELFDGRVPAAFVDRAPRVVTLPQGDEAWEFDGQVFRQMGLNAVVGRPREDWSLEPARFDEMRPGCWDVDERIKDMDLVGVYASISFPSAITGFCGSVFSRCSDPHLGLAVTRAWNDWLHEAWCGAYPDRLIRMGITWLADPEIGAAEIRRNAKRGFVAVTLPEQPHNIGLPSIFSGYWDPILRACEDTGTVVCLHVGSSGMPPMPSDAPALELSASYFSGLSLVTCCEWLWSGVPVRFPALKVVLAEGGIGWVPMLLDRLDFRVDHSPTSGSTWPSSELRPSEVLRRNFWFCFLDDPSTMPILERIGIDHVLFETDYPHADSLWPRVQSHAHGLFQDIPPSTVRKVTHENAAALFRHPLPAKALPPDA